MHLPVELKRDADQIRDRIRKLLRYVGALGGVVFSRIGSVGVGPHGLALFGEQRPIVDFLSELGKLLLMFMAGDASGGSAATAQDGILTALR